MSPLKNNPPRWHELTAIFGGTFDPPHIGHQEAVRGLFREPGVARVVVVPSAIPPHKSSQIAAEVRLKLAELCFMGEKAGPVEISPLELIRASHSGISYSFDTIQELKKQSPKLAFVVGSDQLAKLSTWHRFPEVLGACHWIVLERKPNGRDLSLDTLREWQAVGLVTSTRESSLFEFPRWGTYLRLTPTDAPEISSSDIRQEIARSGQPAPATLPEPVMAYLKQWRLYGTEKA